MTEATLIVGSSSTQCSNCHRETLPTWKTHERVSGYGDWPRACGAVFTAITSCYHMTPELRVRLAEMRPDLPIVGRIRSPFTAPENN